MQNPSQEAGVTEFSYEVYRKRNTGFYHEIYRKGNGETGPELPRMEDLTEDTP
jgi:hypothetical protein